MQSLLSTTYKIQSNILQSRLKQYAEEIIGEHHMDFEATGQLMTIHFAFVKYLKKWEYNESVNYYV